MKVQSIVVLALFFYTSIDFGFAQSTKWKIEIDSADIFSSPRFTDLNSDGIKDIVIGAGDENKPCQNGILAINGENGDIIWNVPSRTQIYTSALFQDITGDGIQDVFIGGRAASYFVINGATGEIIWEFWKGTSKSSKEKGWLNFFGTQWIPDQNRDGFKDLLVTNGGDYEALPDKRNRSRANLMVLSAVDGKILSIAEFPENRESYYAPHVYCNQDVPTVVFGTGGETIDGALWEIPIKNLFKNNISKADLIVRDSTKGFILNSVMADLNNDGNSDFISARMDATISAINGESHDLLWEHQFDGYECYVTPSLGQFIGDATLDVFTIIAKGTFPNYKSFKLIVVEGSTGKIAAEEKRGFNQFSPGISFDMDNDGYDEIIFIENSMTDPESYTMENQLIAYNVQAKDFITLGSKRKGISMASSPGIIDLDQNGTHEIIVATSSISFGGAKQYSIIERIDLNRKIEKITWPGYLGPNENGLIE